MGKLNRQQFRDRYHTMDSRGSSCVANCNLCLYGGERCIHPDRSRPVLLSIADGGYGFDARRYFGKDRVCNAVNIPMPEDIVVPELPDHHAVHIRTRSWSVDMYHGNPRCAYIAAFFMEQTGRTEYLGEGVRMVDLTGHARLSGCRCELPGCGDVLGIPPQLPDEHLRRHRYPDGYVEYPATPPLTFPDGDDALEEFPEGQLIITLGQSGWLRAKLDETEIADMVRRVKRMVKGDRRLNWNTLISVLRSLGLREVADRLDFDWKVQVLDQRYCYQCIVYDNTWNSPIVRIEDRACCEKHHVVLVDRRGLGTLPE